MKNHVARPIRTLSISALLLALACQQNLPVVQDSPEPTGCADPGACGASTATHGEPDNVAGRANGREDSRPAVPPQAGAMPVQAGSDANAGAAASPSTMTMGAEPSSAGVGATLIDAGAPPLTAGAAAHPVSASDAGPPLLGTGAACVQDANCSSGYCNQVCSLKKPNGAMCSASKDCESEHCQNRLCCNSGDCCTSAMDCPASYASPPTCDNPQTCQGTRRAPVCTAGQCASMTIMDDSACTTAFVTLSCGAFVDLRCSGSQNQPAPTCPRSCNDTYRCEDGNFCDASRGCLPLRRDGEACNAGFQCVSMDCRSNGLCCSGGHDCCQTADQCTDEKYSSWNCRAPVCLGTRADAACNAGRCERGENYLAPEECLGYSAYCVKTQTWPMCPATCACDSDADCTKESICQGGICIDSGILPLP